MMLPHNHQNQLQGQTMAYGRQNGATNQALHHHQQVGGYSLSPHPPPQQQPPNSTGVLMQQPMSLTHTPMQQDHQMNQHHPQHQQLHQHQHHLHHHQQQQVNHDQQQQQQQQQQQYRQQQQQHDQIRDHLNLLVQSTHQTAELLRNSCQLQEDLIIRTQDRAKLLSKKNIQEANNDLSGIEKTKAELSSREMLIRQIGSELKDIRCRVFAQLKDIFEQMTAIQNTVLYEHLPRWHQDQQLVNNEAKTENNALDQIQVWVEMLTDITWRLRNQLKALHYYVRGLGTFNLEELNVLGLSINRSLEVLVLSTFVVEKQPPQVMKTNTRFTSTVRFLSGARLNVQMINPTVKATILSESNARAIIQRHQEIIRASWAYLENPVTNSQLQQSPPQQQQAGILSPNQTHPTNQNITNHSNQSAPHAAASQPPSYHQAIHQSQPPATQQQQFFQQQHPPQQFHVQQQQQQQSQPAMAHYQQVQPEMGYYPQKILNINEFDASGEILNSSNILEYQETTRQLVCNFRNMQLKKIKRTEKKGTESVMDEKFILLFHAEFRIAEPYLADNSCSNSTNAISWVKQGDLSFHIMAFSLPVVVIVHGNQEPHAWATVTWHNAFARPDDVLYQVPDKVYWNDLGQVLSDKFRAFAGKGLSPQNLEYLASKVCRNHVDSSQLMVTWNQFAKEPLPEQPDKSFTFWEWFHSILKLTKEHLRDLWNADRIYGFVGKKGCVDLLLGSAFNEPTSAGTFLLRFSETELGGITIAWVSSSTQSNQNGHIQMLQRRSPTNTSSNVLMHLQPFVSKDLNTRTLADRIRDLDDLVYLFPDIPKDDAFRSYYSPLNDTAPLTNGYVKPMLVQTLVTNYPKNLTTSSMDFAVTPATPNSFSQSSPDGICSDNNWNDTDRMG